MNGTLLDAPLYKKLDASTYVCYDPLANRYRVVPAHTVPPLVPVPGERVRLAQPVKPGRNARRVAAKPGLSPQLLRKILMLAMLEVQQKANDAGDPQSAVPLLAKLSAMLRDPNAAKSLRLSMTWNEGLHPRGQPDNPGEFAPKGGGESHHDHEADYKANGTRAKAFKSWFGDWEGEPHHASKVVSPETGEPKETYEFKPARVYHGTSSGGFTQFDKAKRDPNALFGGGFYFTEDRGVAESYLAKGAGESKEIKEAYLSIKNPFDADKDSITARQLGLKVPSWGFRSDYFEGAHTVKGSKYTSLPTPDGIVGADTPLNIEYWRAFGRNTGELGEMDEHGDNVTGIADDISKRLQKAGYDGITHIGGDRMGGGKNHRVWIAFEPTQIKAVDNVGTFDPTHPDMRLSWVAQTSKTGHLKAVGQDIHAGRTLYGKQAESALRAQQQLTPRGDLTGGKLTRQRNIVDSIEHQHETGQKIQAANKAVRGILDRISKNEHAPEDLEALATHLPYLPRQRLAYARQLLGAQLGGGRKRDAIVASVSQKAFELATGIKAETKEKQKAAQAEHLDALADDPAGHAAKHADSLDLHDAMSAALRGEHGPEKQEAVKAGIGDWGFHGGKLAKKYESVGRELAKGKPKPPEPTAPPPTMTKEEAKKLVATLPVPESLPDKPSDYFHVHEADKIVPLGQIKNLRQRPEGVENAAKFMEASRRGLMPKRSPLKVVENGDGTYTVADGNSTFANAKKNNWKELPVKIVPLDYLHDEQRHTVEKEHTKAVGKMANDKFFTPEELALPKKGVASAHNEKDALYAAAVKAKPVYDKILDAGEGVEKALGATVVSPASAADFTAALEKPGPIVIMAPLKGEKRATEKVNADYGGNWNQLHDLLRSSIAVDNAHEIPKAIDALKTSLAEKGWKLAKQPKNRFAKPTLEGYSDVMLNVVGPEGVVSEVQIHLKGMLKAKEEAHKHYEAQRSLVAKMKTEGRDRLTPEEQDAHAKLVEGQRKIYGSAWLKSLGLHEGEGHADDVQLGHLNKLLEMRHGADWQKDLAEQGVKDGNDSVPGLEHPGLLRDGERPAGSDPGRREPAAGVQGGQVGDGVPESGGVDAGVGSNRQGGVRPAGEPAQPVAANPAPTPPAPAPTEGPPNLTGMRHVLGDATTIDAAGYDKPIPAHFAVVDLAHLKPSHSYASGGPSARKDYPANLQPRDYASGSSEDMKVRDMARRMQVRYHLADTPDASNGSPTITPDGTVLNGNARAMSLELAAQTPGKFDEYRRALEKKAAGFGVDPASLKHMTHPVLVRVVKMDPHGDEAKKFAGAGNVAATQSQSPIRTAASLARVIDNDLLDSLRLNEDTTFSDAVSHPQTGRAFREHLREMMPAQAVDQYFTPDGGLTEGGTELVRSMLLSKILPVDLVERLGESHKGLKRTIEAAIPQLLKVRRDHAEADLSPQLAEALNFMADNPKATSPVSVDNVLSQGSLFGGKAAELSPAGRMMVDFLNANGDKPRVARKKIGQFVGDLAAKNGLYGEHMPDVPALAAEALGVSERSGASFGGGTAAPEAAEPEKPAVAPEPGFVAPGTDTSTRQTRDTGLEDVSDSDLEAMAARGGRGERTMAAEEQSRRKAAAPPQPKPAPPKPAEPPAPVAAHLNPHIKLAGHFANHLRAGKSLTAKDVFAAADEHHGGSRAEGKYGPSDAYDSLEAGFNKALAGQTDPTAGLEDAQEQARQIASRVQQLPTQTARSGNKDSFQQFSTPPHYAFAATWLANLTPADTVLEPSAGTGSLAVHAKNSGAHVVTNELDPRRADFLRDQFGHENVHVENAEQIAGILPKKGVKPAVVVMNPPFSQTAGRMGDKKEMMTAPKHIGEGLQLLPEGGRLVAIVGRGMSPESPTFREWFKSLAEKGFTLRANMGVEGDEYKKYGTHFGTRVLVIDKVKPSAENTTVTGDAEDIPDLMAKLEGVRNDRPELADEASGAAVRGGVPEEAESAGRSAGSTALGDDNRVPAEDAGKRVPVAGVQDRTAGASGDAGDGRSGVDDVAAGSGPRSAGGGSGRGGRGQAGGSGRAPEQAAGGTQGSLNDPSRRKTSRRKSLRELEVRPPELRPVEPIPVKVRPVSTVPTHGGSDSPDSLYEEYRPARLMIPGAVPHTTKLVESAAMASVAPPLPTYQPHLSPDLITGGKYTTIVNEDGSESRREVGLSEAGLESVVYAGQSHQQFLPAAEGAAPTRRGYFIGDGTGAGKGRQIGGIILDNWNQGRKKHVWISEKDKLFNDAKRDWTDIGMDPQQLVNWSDLQKGGFAHKDGVAFVTYSTLRSGPTDKEKPRNVDALIQWLGTDFDGVIAMDEAHNMGNADDTPGARGTVKASQQAVAAMKLQRAMPKARIVYVSATGATKVENLAYGDRLGLWGRGTSFANKAEFLDAMERGGTAALEAVAQSMKARGLYGARSLSYDGVKTDRLTHKLTDDQHYIYDSLAEGWQSVLQNIDKAIEHLAGGEKDAKKAGQVRAAAMSQFWGAQQRFFNQVLTSMKIPTVIKGIEEDLKVGRAPVVQLVNTMESATKRALAGREDDQELEELDISPKTMLVEFLKTSFPVHRLQEVTDENGNSHMVYVKDSQGHMVEDPEMVAKRDELIARAHDLNIPSSPLDQLINHFGHDQVAECTGRTKRLIKKADDTGKVRLQEERRDPKNSNEAEARAFQAGKKKLLIFSEAGGTGASYHADRNAVNQSQRTHYLLQPGWRADKAVQGLGRTHRTNQAEPPWMRLCEVADVPGERRFMSTIARRLAQLGALTRGQAKTGTGGLFSEADNLESREAQAGLESFFHDLKYGQVEGMDYHDTMKSLGFKVEENEQTGRRSSRQSDVPEMRQFLNRMLALKVMDQQKLFGTLEEYIKSKIEQAEKDGTRDSGVENFKADKIVKLGEQTVYRDPNTGAEAKLVRTIAHRKSDRRPWKATQEGTLPLRFVKNRKSGRVWAVYKAAPKTDERTGQVIPQYALKGATGSYGFVPQHTLESYQSNYNNIEHDEAKQLWEDEYNDAPETTESPEHFVTGDMLAVWDKLPGDRPKIYRARTSDGQSLVGRHIPADVLETTLGRLGAHGDTGKAEHDPAATHRRIQSGAATATLANGWRVKRSRVGNEWRIEVTGPTGLHKRELEEDGVSVVRMDYKDRYFVPVGPAGERVLERIVKSRNAPITAVDAT